MKYVIRVDITDALTVEALDKAIKSRKMARLVADALSHYVRTKEGKASVELLPKASSNTDGPVGKSAKAVSTSKSKTKVEKSKTVVPINDFLSFTKDND